MTSEERTSLSDKKAELVISALQQRMGELVVSYETQIALYRAEITEMMEELKSLSASVKN
jgi:hypothetical protein